MMREDRKTVRRGRPVARLVLALLAVALIVGSIIYLLLAGSERIYLADDLAGALPSSPALAELAPGETAQGAVLKRGALGGIDDFVLTDRRLIRIRDRDRWSFPLARWTGFGYRGADGATKFEFSTIDDHRIYLSVETTPAAERLREALAEAYEQRPDRDDATPASELPAPQPLGAFEHPDFGYVIWLAPLILGLLGLLILTIGLRALRNARYRLRHQERATGTVTGHVTDSFTDDDGHDWTVYHPQVEFTTRDGRQVTFKGRLGRGRKQPRGHALKVLYDPKRPEDAMIHGFASLYFLPTIAGILGLAALAWAGSLVWFILSEL